jgi:hypothetical protein
MAEETKAPQGESISGEALVCDWFLQMLVKAVDTSVHLGTGITLNVGGILISGQLVSAQKYMEQTLGGLADARTQIGVSAESAAKLKDGLPEQAAEGGTLDQGPAFIHLKDARFHALGKNGWPQDGCWWRGKLSAVDGFVLGKITATPAMR